MNLEKICELRKKINKVTGAQNAVLSSPEIVSLAREIEQEIMSLQTV